MPRRPKVDMVEAYQVGLGSPLYFEYRKNKLSSPDPFFPYGKTTKTQTVETNNPYAYTSRELDDSDLYYYRARYYDPTAQRFLSEDPIGFNSGDFNFYRYVGNSPVNFTDPSGLRCTYSQSTGSMTCVDDQTGVTYYNETGYSGTGTGRNNPDAQDQEDVGPIPRGEWEFGEPYQSDHTGPNTLPLIPLPGNSCTNTGRQCDTFRAHGNNSANDASQGCIVLPPNRTRIPNGEVVEVVR